MSSDPERPIEKLLRGCAEKRREEAGAPLELHPATRRLLQGEVVRRFGKPPPQAGPAGLLRAFWPRVAWVFAAAAALVAIVLLFLPAHTQKPDLLAKNETVIKSAPLEERQLAAAADRAPAKSTAPEAAGGTSLQTSTEPSAATTLAQSSASAPEPSAQLPKQLALRAENSVRRDSVQPLNAPAAPAPATVPAASPTTVSGPTFAERELAKTTGVAATAAPSAVDRSFATRYGLAAPATAALAQAVNDGSTELRLRFVQTENKAKAPVTDQLSSPTTVLSSFQVEQSNARLRIIDSDGSVYEGYIQPAESGTPTVNAKAQKDVTLNQRQLAETRGAPTATPPPSVAPQAWSNYFFRVVGTNLTLNQRVVFAGNLAYPTDFLRSAAETGGINGARVGGIRFDSETTNPSPLLNSRISGKALLDDRREIEINALPAKP